VSKERDDGQQQGGLTVFVQIDLADPAHCDGCPCLREDRCQAFGVWLKEETQQHPYPLLRPQVCIKASAAIRAEIVEGDA